MPWTEIPEQEQNTKLQNFPNPQIFKSQKLCLKPKSVTQHLKIAFIRESKVKIKTWIESMGKIRSYNISYREHGFISYIPYFDWRIS